MPDQTSSLKPARRFPRWAKVLAYAVGALVVLALIAPYFLNVEHYRGDISSAIEKQTGRSVSLGKIRARFLPHVGFVVENFQLGNPKGFAAGEFMTAEAIRGNLTLWPLIHGDIHLSSLELVRPKLMLITNERGQNNYTFASPASAQETQAAPELRPVAGSTAQPSASSSSFQLDAIETIELSSLEVILGGVDHGKVATSADAKGINVTLHNLAVSPMRVHDWVADCDLTGITLALEGWSQPIAFRSGHISLQNGKLDSQFAANLAKASDIKGTLHVDDVERTQVNFDMTSPQLDLDVLLAAAGGASSSPAAKPAAGDDPPQAADKNQLLAQGKIHIDKIISKPYQAGPASAELRAYADRAELWPVTVGLYGGTLQISARADRAANPPRFSSNVQLRNVDVGKALEAAPAARGKMAGTAEMDLQLFGALSDAWRKSLSGTGKFAIRNGKLPGVDLGGIAGSLVKTAGVGKDTPFTVLQGDINIADQRVNSKQIHLDSPSGLVDLSGSLGLDGSLDYQGQVTITPGETASSGGSAGANLLGGVVGGFLGRAVGKITVPFALSGTVADPKVRPGKALPTVGNSSKPNKTPQQNTNPLSNLLKKHN